jgi:cbb3-type cytochrome oxidase maturation protein
MASLYLLVPIALLFCALAIRLLLWAIDSGQYDDLDKEAWRVIMDDEDPPTNGSPGQYAEPREQRPPSP